MSISIEGKIAVITGAASGIGREGCLLFSRCGAKVAAVDIDGRGLKDTIDAIRSFGGQADAIVADLSNPARANTIIGEAVGIYGGLDVLWNHAGMSGPLDIENLDLESYNTTINLNLTAGVLTSGAAIPHMRRRGGGSILFTSSTSGLVGSPLYAIYSATKFALIGFTKTMAQRLAADGIRVNALCPGPVRTPMVQKLNQSGLSGEEFVARLVASVPLGRQAEPVEIARAALWLASDEASYVTGVALPVDGGYTAR